jgi:hypothetical protein
VVPRTVKINIQKSIKEAISKYRGGGGGKEPILELEEKTGFMYCIPV